MPWLAAAAPAIVGILGQVVGGVLGNNAASSAASKIYSQPVGNIRTGYSQAQSGSVMLDPTIRALRESLLGQYQALGPQYSSLLSQAGMNSPNYVRSIVDPYDAAIARAGGDIMMGQQNRDIRGSSFGNQELTNFVTDTGRQRGNILAQAINSSINQQAGLLGEYGRNVLAPQDVLNQQELEQELAALGIGLTQAQAMVNQSIAAQAARAGGQAAQGGALMGIGNILGSLKFGGGGGGGSAPMPTMGGGLPMFS